METNDCLNIQNCDREQAAHDTTRFGKGDRLSQPAYDAFAFYSRQKLGEKLVYMHQNLVRAGLVERAVDWRWSSARWYEWRGSIRRVNLLWQAISVGCKANQTLATPRRPGNNVPVRWVISIQGHEE